MDPRGGGLRKGGLSPLLTFFRFKHKPMRPLHINRLVSSTHAHVHDTVQSSVTERGKLITRQSADIGIIQTPSLQCPPPWEVSPI